MSKPDDNSLTGTQPSAVKRAGGPALVCLFIGMGICWAMEGLVVQSVTAGLPWSNEPFSLFYLIQSPSLIVCALLFMLVPGMEKIVSSTRLQIGLVVFALADLALMAASPSGSPVAIGGMELFSIVPTAINLLWFCDFGRISPNYANLGILGTAVTPLIGLPVNVYVEGPLLLVVAGACLLASYLAYRYFHRNIDPFLPLHQPKQTRVFSNQFPVVLGIFILMACSSYLRIADYDYSWAHPVAASIIPRLIAIAAIVVIVYLAKDSERILTVKVTLFFMLFALAESFVLRPSPTVSVQLVSGVQSMFDIVAFVALAQMTHYGFIRKGWAIGAYQLVGALAVIAGELCFGIGRHPMMSGYEAVPSLVLMAALIIAALWLLTGDRVFNFLWGHPAEERNAENNLVGDIARDSSMTEGRAGESADIEERAVGWEAGADRGDPVAEVASEFQLTGRERDVLELLSKGRSSTYIAEQLFVSQNTVRSHITHIYAKCNVHSRQEIITLIDSRR